MFNQILLFYSVFLKRMRLMPIIRFSYFVLLIFYRKYVFTIIYSKKVYLTLIMGFISLY